MFENEYSDYLAELYEITADDMEEMFQWAQENGLA